MENKSTQEKIDAIIEQLKVNGHWANEYAADLPACLAHLEDPVFQLVAETFHTFRRIWERFPNCTPLMTSLCLLIEREKVRRELTKGVEVAWLSKISELT